MFIKINLWIVYIFLCGIKLFANGQFTRSGCPVGWVIFQKTCYKFESDSLKIYEEADSDCWTYGATLLEVDSNAEHNFVANWLLQNDILFHSTWFTSGFFSEDHVIWETHPDNHNNILPPEWNAQPHEDKIFNHVAYQYSGLLHNQYRWSLVSPSIPSSYICEIPQAGSLAIGLQHRDFSYGLGFVQPGNLSHGPVIVKEPVGVVVYGSGQPIMLECRAQAHPPPRYRWYRGRREVTDTDREAVTDSNHRYTLSEGRLTIDQPEQNEDGGYYWCTAENQFGLITSQRAQILFGYLHAFPPVKPDDQNGTAFMGVRLSCLTPAYSPTVQFSWFKFHTHNFVYSNHPYHFVSQSGYLYFSEVQPTDDRKYYCVVTLGHSDFMTADSTSPPSRVSLGTYLNIRPGKNDNNYGPIIFTHVFPSPPLRGSTIRIECIAYGSLPLTYSWRREDGRPFVKGTKMEARNRVLTIPNAPLEAEGKYICTVKRPNAVKSSVVDLVMETRPYFSNPVKDMLVDPDQRVKWLCKAIARPRATYTWFKNGQRITNTPGVIEVKAKILTIQKVDKARDEGMYQCAATNQHGTTYSTGQLKVISFAPNFKRYPMVPYILAANGGEITLPCRVEGAPIPEVRWTKNGGDLSLYPGNMDGRLGMTLSYALVITEIQPSDLGTYTCTGSNIFGEASNSTYVRVVNGVVIDTPPADATVVTNTTHFLACSASHNYVELDLIYQWQFNGHEIDFHRNPHFVMGKKQGTRGLYIRGAGYAQSGIFTCVARTPLAADRKSAVITMTGTPGAPAGVYVDPISVTSQEARVVWTVTDTTSHGAAINAYDVEGETNYYPGEWHAIMTDVQEPVAVQTAVDALNRADQRSVVVSGLIPNTDYRFRIRAINYYGRGQEASLPSASIKTPATRPVIPPANVTGGGGKVGTLVIKWKPLPPAEQCGSGIGYRVYWRRFDEEKPGSWKKEILKGDIGKFVTTVGEDNYFLQYQVMVGGFNDLGDGPNSTVKIVYSAMGLPVAVPTVTGYAGINGTTVIVYFTPVEDDREHVKGRVRGYTCQYYLNDQGCNPMTGCKLTNLHKKNVWGQASEIMLINLELNQEYFFRMQVLNQAGKGPIGEWRRGESAGYAPLRYPRFVKVTTVDEHSVRVKWQGVQTTVDEEIITGYKVKVWMVNTDIRNANETLSDRLHNNVVVYGLQTQTVYQLRVQGVSAGGDGAMSEPVYFTIKGGPIQIDPGTTNICFEDRTCSLGTTTVLSYCTVFMTLFYHIFTYLL